MELTYTNESQEVEVSASNVLSGLDQLVEADCDLHNGWLHCREDGYFALVQLNDKRTSQELASLVRSCFTKRDTINATS